MSRSVCRLAYPALLACVLACWLYLLYTRSFSGLSAYAAAYAAAAREGVDSGLSAGHGRLAILAGTVLMRLMPPWDTSILMLASVARLGLALTVYALAIRYTRPWIGGLAALFVCCLPGGSSAVGFVGLTGLMAAPLLLAGWALAAAESSGPGRMTLPSIRTDAFAALSMTAAIYVCPSLWSLWPIWLLLIARQSREYVRARLWITAGVSGVLLAMAWIGGWLVSGRFDLGDPWPDLVKALGGVGLTGALVAGGYLLRTNYRLAALPHLLSLVGLIIAAALTADRASVACAAIGPVVMVGCLVTQHCVDCVATPSQIQRIAGLAVAVALAAAGWALYPGIDREARAERVVLFKAGARLAELRDADAARSQILGEDDILNPLRIWAGLARPQTKEQREMAAQLTPAFRRQLERGPVDARGARSLLASELARICRDGWSGSYHANAKRHPYGERYAGARDAREQIDRVWRGCVRAASPARAISWTGLTGSVPLTAWYARGKWCAYPEPSVHTSRCPSGQWERQVDWSGMAAQLKRRHVDAILVTKDVLARQDAWGELTRRLLRQDDGEPRSIPAGFTLGGQDWAPVAWWPDTVLTARTRWYGVLYRPVRK